MQVLKNIEDDWPLLWDAYYEFHKRCPPMTALKLYQTAEGKAYVKRVMEVYLSLGNDCPPVIAWDPVKNQVKSTYMCESPFQAISWWLWLEACKHYAGLHKPFMVSYLSGRSSYSPLCNFEIIFYVFAHANILKLHN